MPSNNSGSSHSPKRRKPRPSRGRGLRTTAGCLTCRRRRLKCNEAKPDCGQCIKSSRECIYAQDRRTSPSEPPLPTSTYQPDEPHPRSNAALKVSELLENATPGPAPSDLGSPLTSVTSFSHGNAPHYWYDLIAEDAVKNIDNYNFLTTSGARWSFEPRLAVRLSEQASTPAARPVSNLHHSPKVSFDQGGIQFAETSGPSYASLSNTIEPPSLREHELKYLQHYLDVVAPILDLFDSQQHFKTHVLHLALRNVGLLKSVLALSALYKARCADLAASTSTEVWHSENFEGAQPMVDQDMATQYYYETLNYLAQAMQYPGYPHSQEILANAALISWYEALDTETSTNWERHLKGVFWIQRSQNTNGEAEGLRKAVWWNWLRQDIWAAFRHSRKTLTIWRPTKALQELSSEDLACRALYLQAKAIGYASDETRQDLDFGARIQEGNRLLDALQEWYTSLPRTFRPLPSASDASTDTMFPPIWIHPPIFAAAMQAYYSAKILVLLNRPSLGGREAYHDNQRALDECVATICGISQGPNSVEIPLGFVNSQALFFAGQCARTQQQQDTLLMLLDRTLDITRFPSKTLLDELRLLWSKS